MDKSHFLVAMSRCYSEHTIEPKPRQQKLICIDLQGIKFNYTCYLDMLHSCYIYFLWSFCWI